MNHDRLARFRERRGLCGHALILGLAVATAAATLATMTATASPASAAPAFPTLYVVESTAGQLTPVAVGSSTPGSPIPVGSQPQFVAISPNGSTAFVSNFGAGTVSPVDLTTGTAGTAINVGSGSKPEGIAVSFDGKTAYVVDSGSNQVTPIDVSGKSAGTPIFAGVDPAEIALTPSGTTAYVTNPATATVTPINLGSSAIDAPIAVGVNPMGIAVAPNGGTVYVVNTGSNSVTPITTSNNVAGTPINVGSSPSQIAISPDGRLAYVTNAGSATVSVIDLSNNAVSQIAMPSGLPPAAVAFTPDGTTAFVTSFSGNAVIPINTATQVAGTPITGFHGPEGLAVSPDQAPTARLASSATTVTSGTPVTFDASASTTVYGTITAYQFDFGDGSPKASGGSATASHSYLSPGVFLIRVFELGSGGWFDPSFTGQTASRNAPSYLAASGQIPQNEAEVVVTVTGPPVPSHLPILYAANFAAGSLTPVALPSGAGSPVVGQPVPAGNSPSFPAVTPDGRAVIVPDFTGNTVTPIAACDNGSGGVQFVTGTPADTGTHPLTVAIAPMALSATASQTQWVALVTDFGGNDVRVYVVTVNNNSCGATITQATSVGATVLPNSIPVGTAPWGIAITPNEATAYVSNSTSGTVTPINLTNGQVGLPVPVGLTPSGIAVTPDGATVYVVDAGSNQVTPITTSNNHPGTPIRVGPGPQLISITSDGSTAFVTDSGANPTPLSVGGSGLPGVTSIDLSTNQVNNSITLPGTAAPGGIAITPDGSTVFVDSYSSGVVFPISRNGQVGTPLTGFAGPLGLAMTPDQAPVARLSLSASSVSVGTTVTLDASASTVAFGSITGYQFYFGDGTAPVLGASPTMTHTYSTSGTFVAQVWEVDSAGTSYLSSYSGQAYGRYAPQHNGIAQDNAVAVLTVTAPNVPIPSHTPVIYSADLSAGVVTPIAVPANGSPLVGSTIPTGSGAANAAATADGTAAVVTNYNANTATPVSVCDPGGGSVNFKTGASVSTGVQPFGVAISPKPISTVGTRTTWRVLVADLGANDVRQYVLTVDTAACTATLVAQTPLSAAVIPVGANPYGVAITPDGSTAYVTNHGSATVTPITLSTGSPGVPIPVGQGPEGIAVTPDGAMLYVVDNGSNDVTPITISSNTPGIPVQVGTAPAVIAITPDGTTAVVNNTGSSSISEINLGANQVARTVPLPSGDSATSVMLSSDGSTAWVSSYGTGSLVPVSVATGAITLGSVISGLPGPIGGASSVTP